MKLEYRCKVKGCGAIVRRRGNADLETHLREKHSDVYEDMIAAQREYESRRVDLRKNFQERKILYWYEEVE